MRGWKAALGCTHESLALFRISLGLLLVLELVLRFRFLHPFYSDEGTWPLHLFLDEVDDLYKLVCLHCHFGLLWQQQVLLSVQVIVAVLLTVGYKTRWTSVVSWFLYLSLSLRNTWMNYILDRYFHYLLFLSVFLPLEECWAVSSSSKQTRKNKNNPDRGGRIVISPATIALKALVTWIYLDAGWGKYADPLKGWTYNANPLPALDTYARHTLAARYLYALIGPPGLRLLTPVVVHIELLVVPLALVASWIGSPSLLYVAVSLIWSLHVGIALTLRNSALLSFVACVAWCPFLPVGWKRLDNAGAYDNTNNKNRHNKSASTTERQTTTPSFSKTTGISSHIISAVCILSMVAGNVWIETISRACDQSVKHIWGTMLHNRWNVFVGAEEYVTWEIAPGLLKDGSVVDVWSRHDEVNWNIPGSGAPCTSTARIGRWRSFPYLIGSEGAESEALWSYLCREWNREHDIDRYPERELVKFNFFMLQADVLPNMGFSATRKRLIQAYECIPSSAKNDGETLDQAVTETLPNEDIQQFGEEL